MLVKQSIEKKYIENIDNIVVKLIPKHIHVNNNNIV